MAALGMWLWSRPGSFGSSQPCAQGQPSTVVLGHSVSLESSQLRAWSILIYSLFLAPGLNLFLPSALFFALFLTYQCWHRGPTSKEHEPSYPLLPITDSRRPSSSGSPPALVVDNHLERSSSNTATVRPNSAHSDPSTVPVVLGLALLFAMNIMFIADIELTLRRNRLLQDPGESAWTFGQILALLLLILPLRDLLETMSQRREIKRKAYLTETMQRAIRDEQPMDAILSLVKKGADVNAWVENYTFTTALQLASSRKGAMYLAELLDRKADPHLRVLEGGTYETALIAACSFGHVGNVERLLAMGADPNIRGRGPPCTALVGALSLNPPDWDMVKILLQNGAVPTNAGLE
ncbi:hypothetical protein B0H13DRAFT_1857491 [Mycena leptocephala]|nr:hypothetical protein B0H13DRAFT_1857491 [Mycena leptocephala]